MKLRTDIRKTNAAFIIAIFVMQCLKTVKYFRSTDIFIVRKRPYRCIYKRNMALSLNSVSYQRSEKPAQTLRLFDSLKLKAISTAMGTYMKPNTATIHTRPRFFQRLIPSPPFPRCRQW